MSFSFHPEAEIEFNGAIDYYERIERGLGYDFAIEVYSTIKRSVSLPKAWSVIEGDIWRSLVKRFPYGIYIIAVMHLHRFPDYWKHRK